MQQQAGNRHDSNTSPLSRQDKFANLLTLAIGVLVGLIGATLFGLSGNCVQFNLGDVQRAWFVYPLVAILTGVGLTLIVWPIVHYRRHGQTEQIDRVRSFYSHEVIAEYFNRFLAGRDEYASTVKTFKNSRPDSNERKQAEHELGQKFEEFLRLTFGRDRIGRATIYLGIVAGIILFFAFEGGVMLAIEQGPHKESAHYLLGIKPDIVSLAAIFGAYTWVTSDAIFRYRQGDFNSSDIFWYALRSIVAVPLGAALAAFAPMKGAEGGGIASGSAGPVLAFVIGMFSLSRIQQILSGFTNRAFNVPGAVPEARDDVAIKLPGIDQNVADRLQAENVTTIAQIATADPIRLSSRANIPFGLVLEFIDQAILWKMIGAKLLIFREFGWSGASHLIGFADRRAESIQPALDDYLKKASEARPFNRERITAELNLAAAAQALETAQQNAGPNNTDNEAANQKLAQAQQKVRECASALEQAQAAEKPYQQALDDARKAISAASVPSDVIFDDIAAKADMKASAVRGVVDEIARNEYARFVLRMMQVGATSAASPETASGRAAVPRRS